MNVKIQDLTPGLFTLVFILFFATNLQGSEEKMLPDVNLEVEIQLEKANFRLSDDVLIKIIFKNHSDEDFFINTAFNYIEEETRLTFAIRMPTGEYSLKKLVLMGKRALLNEKDFYLIKRGNFYQTEIPISKWYELNMIGQYTIKANYYNSDNGKMFKLKPFWKFWRKAPMVWTGNIVSNELTFKIIK